jgi:hypothetical protein
LAAVRPELDALAGVGFFLDSELVDQVLLDAGESADIDPSQEG